MLASARIQKGMLGVLVALVAAIAAVLVFDRVKDGPAATTAIPVSGLQGNLMPAHVQAANFTLTDQFGRRVSLGADRGKVVVLTFIYSHCTNSCPFMVEQIKGALNLMGRRAARSVRVIGVSVQPLRDTRSSRLHFLAEKQMAHRMSFLDGPVPVLRHIWKEYGIAPQTRTASHSAFVLVINQRGIEKVGFPAVELTPGSLAHDLDLLQRDPTAA